MSLKNHITFMLSNGDVVFITDIQYDEDSNKFSFDYEAKSDIDVEMVEKEFIEYFNKAINELVAVDDINKLPE